MTHRHLGVADEERLTGAGVSYCATCDGAFFRGGMWPLSAAEAQPFRMPSSFPITAVKFIWCIAEMNSGGGQHCKTSFHERECGVRPEYCGETDSGRKYGGRPDPDGQKTGEDFRLDVAGVFIAVGQIPQNEIFADVVKLDGSGFYPGGGGLSDICAGNLRGRRLPDKGSPSAYNSSC